MITQNVTSCVYENFKTKSILSSTACFDRSIKNAVIIIITIKFSNYFLFEENNNDIVILETGYDCFEKSEITCNI